MSTNTKKVNIHTISLLSSSEQFEIESKTASVLSSTSTVMYTDLENPKLVYFLVLGLTQYPQKYCQKRHPEVATWYFCKGWI